MDSLGLFAPKIELYSIDEAFLDLGEMRKKDLRQLGVDIRKTIKKNLGIPGISRYRFHENAGENGQPARQKTL